MKNNAFWWIARGSTVLAAATGIGGLNLALAADREPPRVHYVGLINDYTPSAAVVAKGPFEMRGKWTLDVDERQGTAKFSVVMTMETSDFGITQGNVDKDTPMSRSPHAHHIVMTDGVVSPDWMGSCAKSFSPAVSQGFVVTGSAFVTANGSPPPNFTNPSPLTLCVAGGPNVKFSSFAMTFGSPASGHFGTFAIHGVVARCAGPWEFESKDCTVQE
jgi:hypothetical protein